MRIGTWNCAQALNKKLVRVLELGADICVLPEAGRHIAGLPQGAKYLWIGTSHNKGLGILSRGLDIEIDPIMDESWCYFAPIRVDGDRFRLLAVWAFNHRADTRGPNAIGRPLAVFEKLDEWLTEKETVVAGDFNNSVVWDRPNKPTNFRLVNEWLEGRGFVSAYHSFFKETLGDEKNATHYHLKLPERPYHIDYIYTNRPVRIALTSVGDPKDWIRHSDHVPVVLEQHDF